VPSLVAQAALQHFQVQQKAPYTPCQKAESNVVEHVVSSLVLFSLECSFVHFPWM
jgi:hypothetical protein